MSEAICGTAKGEVCPRISLRSSGLRLLLINTAHNLSHEKEQKRGVGPGNTQLILPGIRRGVSVSPTGSPDERRAAQLRSLAAWRKARRDIRGTPACRHRGAPSARLHCLMRATRL